MPQRWDPKIKRLPQITVRYTEIIQKFAKKGFYNFSIHLYGKQGGLDQYPLHSWRAVDIADEGDPEIRLMLMDLANINGQLENARLNLDSIIWENSYADVDVDVDVVKCGETSTTTKKPKVLRDEIDQTIAHFSSEGFVSFSIRLFGVSSTKDENVELARWTAFDHIDMNRMDIVERTEQVKVLEKRMKESQRRLESKVWGLKQ